MHLTLNPCWLLHVQKPFPVAFLGQGAPSIQLHNTTTDHDPQFKNLRFRECEWLLSLSTEHEPERVMDMKYQG